MCGSCTPWGTLHDNSLIYFLVQKIPVNLYTNSMQEIRSIWQNVLHSVRINSGRIMCLIFRIHPSQKFVYLQSWLLLN